MHQMHRLVMSAAIGVSPALVFASYQPSVDRANLSAHVWNREKIYIVNYLSDTLSVVDSTDYSSQRAIHVGQAPKRAIFRPYTEQLYVIYFRSSNNANDITIIDTLTDTVSATLTVMAPIEDLVFAQDGGTGFAIVGGDLYSLDQDGSVSALVVNLPRGMSELVLSPDRSHVYLAGGGSIAEPATGRKVLALDLRTHLLSDLLSPDEVPTGIAISNDGRYLYTTGLLTFDGASGRRPALTIVDTMSNIRLATIPVGQGASGLAVHPSGSPVFVDHYGGIDIVDTRDQAPQSSIAVSTWPTALAISQDGATLYAADHSIDTLFAIDTATLSTQASVRVGERPVSIAVKG